MTNASVLASILPPVIIGASTLMIMDASFDVSMEPFRALVADNLFKNNITKGFSIQTTLIGVGAIISSLLPCELASLFGIAKTAKGIASDNLNILFLC